MFSDSLFHISFTVSMFDIVSRLHIGHMWHLLIEITANINIVIYPSCLPITHCVTALTLRGRRTETQRRRSGASVSVPVPVFRFRCQRRGVGFSSGFGVCVVVNPFWSRKEGSQQTALLLVSTSLVNCGKERCLLLAVIPIDFLSCMIL